jgi:hypothetical protein
MYSILPLYRYIKIRFLNHYGSEFYCPLSEIRVHGLTIVEQISAELELDKNDMKYMDDVFASPNHTTATQPPEVPIDKVRVSFVMLNHVSYCSRTRSHRQLVRYQSNRPRLHRRLSRFLAPNPFQLII